MASTKATHNDVNLPITALKLLAPPVRLISAALWKVMKQRDVKLYGVVEEFVTSACETVPGLLTLRHQSKLALGLRGRLILDLCLEQTDATVIKSHLKRISFPSMPSTSSHATVKTDVKITKTVESFHMLVDTLLTDQVAKEQFFKEDFPQEYGPLFDQELEKLLWEFIIRLDQLFPVPTLAQTVSWLSEAPAVLEECAQAATQPQLLKVLLQHQTCLGHLEAAASLPPNMGDSILASLSLPLSGKVPSNPQVRPVKSSGDVSADAETPAKTPFISPVIGLISNEEVPGLSTAGQNCKDDTDFTSIKPMLPKSQSDSVEDGDRRASRRSSGVKRKQAGRGESTSDDEEASGSFRDPYTCSIVASCLNRQPRVVIHELPISKPAGQAGTSFYRHRNHPREASVGASSSHQQCNREAPGPPSDADDYVADSEDEATKNFKGRLFMKRYCKTKHGTYFPTLREFWKPSMGQRNLSLPVHSKRRR
uniref:TERF1-interacting nuclear factor 2 isoform X2 n=1 Tax=Doryrhamphus excisus TaxID=161450 RepID=UPI0025ADB305|nr:TERF1-interacting nuclear factor 2 isoform X2 [Doryrhamphus excisus]